MTAAAPAILPFIEGHQQLLTLLIAAIGGGFALVRHRADQAWNKKQLAFNFVQGMFDDPKTMAALRMLDWDNGEFTEPLVRDFQLREGQHLWDRHDVARALRAHDGGKEEGSGGDAAPPATPQVEGEQLTKGERPGQGVFNRKEYAIRELFDSCLSHFDRLGHFLRTGIITVDDVPAAIAYYPLLGREARCQERDTALRAYMKRYGYSDAMHLFEAVERHNPLGAG